MNQKKRDLATELFHHLQRKSPDHAVRWKALFIDKHPGWNNGTSLTIDEQIHEINEFWRMELGLLDINTLDARSCIVDNVHPDIWLRNFDRYIMSVILGDTLPNIPCHAHTG